MAKNTYNPATDIPSLKGKIFLVTGGTAGLGEGAVEHLAAHSPAHICIMARNAKAAGAIIEKLRAKHKGLSIGFIKCDLASLSSTQAAAREFLGQKHGRLDVLMCNSGVMALDSGVTEDGFEVQFQINHLGHALLIKLLTPLLLDTAVQPGADVRIITLSSYAYRQAPSCGIEFETLRTNQAALGGWLAMHKWVRYGQSKLANLLYPRALARRHPKILSVAVHPGFVFTDLYEHADPFSHIPIFFMSIGKTLPIEQGCYNQLWAATAPREKIENGALYEPFGVPMAKVTKASKDDKLAGKLWDWTEKALESFE